MEEFPERLRRMRGRQSSEALSELCGLNKDAVRRYENGERSPTLKSLIKIAEYFDVSLDYLAGKSDEPRNR